MDLSSPFHISQVYFHEERGCPDGGGTSARRPFHIEKSRSLQNSPTRACKPYFTLEDRWNMIYGSDEDSETCSIYRPSSNYFAPSTSSQLSGHASASALAYVSVVEQRKREAFPLATLEYHQTTDTLPLASIHKSGIQTSSFTNLIHAPAQPCWASSATPPLDTQSSSSECLQVGDSAVFDDCRMEDESSREPSNVLIGMGLYETPSYRSPLTPGLGIGLKLEEPWRPPLSRADHEDMEDHQGSSDVESLTGPPDLANQAANMGNNERFGMLQASTVALPAEVPFSRNNHFFGGEEDMDASEQWSAHLKRRTVNGPALAFRPVGHDTGPQ